MSTRTGQTGQKTATGTGQRPSPHHVPPRPLSAKAQLEAARRRRALLRPEPDRIIEIQKALVQAGYPNVQLSGLWDDATRDAMRGYQAANGFSPTGLPDAKSLMKLGLGPHPLPTELENGSTKPAGDTATRTPSGSAEGSRQ
jgi:peptidoglycan hydrolase-like protein with peptidoglycan-binding domain